MGGGAAWELADAFVVEDDGGAGGVDEDGYAFADDEGLGVIDGNAIIADEFDGEGLEGRALLRGSDRGLEVVGGHGVNVPRWG